MTQTRGTFWPVTGHTWATDLLAARLAHGRAGAPVLFTGPDGVGRSTLARAYAQALNCTGERPPCGTCRACTLIAAERHPDMLLVAPQTSGKVVISEEIKIEQIRELIHVLSLSPVEARRRIAIISRCETLNGTAANALLKTLEEPPGQATLLLTARSADELWPTIVSRCQVIPLRPLPEASVRAALIENWQQDPERATALARIAGGRLGWAVRAAQAPEVLARREDALALLLTMLDATRVERFATAERLAKDSAALRETLDIWLGWWREVVLVAAGRPGAAGLAAPAARYGLPGAAAALQAVLRARDQLERNAQPRLVVEVLLLALPGPSSRA